MVAQPSRRSVLRAAVMLAAAASTPLLGAQRAFSLAPGEGGALRRSAFRPHVGSSFALAASGVTYRAKLVKVADVRTAARGHEKKFRLMFDVRGSGPGAGTYRFSHPSYGAVDLFVSPVGAEAGAYEAVVDAG
ncbi:MAG TPA: hypothetical protein VFQ85_03680 [Mycobacteriales bacterium]|jgi:hypothetical protein|nr:hypothetical protein [Mycobacteriales bacterium]